MPIYGFMLCNVRYATGGIQLGTSSGGLQSGGGLKLGTGYYHMM